MGVLKKKSDPLSARARALNHEIEKLESEIRKLDAQLHQMSGSPGVPRLRSTALPRGQVLTHAASPASGAMPSVPPRPNDDAGAGEPIFEEVDRRRLKGSGLPASTPAHFNDLGVRKYDLYSLLERIRQHLRGPSASNPKLVNYLAAGGVQGLRPLLRYERRVARNRFIALVVVLFVLLFGIICFLVRTP